MGRLLAEDTKVAQTLQRGQMFVAGIELVQRCHRGTSIGLQDALPERLAWNIFAHERSLALESRPESWAWLLQLET